MVKWLVLIGMLYIYNYYQSAIFKVYKYSAVSSKINRELRLIQISDYHVNKYINLHKLEKDIEEFQPEAVLLTGDMFNRDTEDFQILQSLLSILKSEKRQILYVTGNHEGENKHFAESKALIKDYGIKYFKEHEIYRLREDVNIHGLNYGKEQHSCEINVDNYNIVLVHAYNIYAFKNETPPPSDLILAGHTHGGQVRFPLIGQIIGHKMEWFPKFSKGHYKLNEDTDLYISGGLGNSSLNIRSLNRVGYTNIKISPLL